MTASAPPESESPARRKAWLAKWAAEPPDADPFVCPTCLGGGLMRSDYDTSMVPCTVCSEPPAGLPTYQKWPSHQFAVANGDNSPPTFVVTVEDGLRVVRRDGRVVSGPCWR